MNKTSRRDLLNAGDGGDTGAANAHGLEQEKSALRRRRAEAIQDAPVSPYDPRFLVTAQRQPTKLTAARRISPVIEVSSLVKALQRKSVHQRLLPLRVAQATCTGTYFQVPGLEEGMRRALLELQRDSLQTSRDFTSRNPAWKRRMEEHMDQWERRYERAKTSQKSVHYLSTEMVVHFQQAFQIMIEQGNMYANMFADIKKAYDGKIHQLIAEQQELRFLHTKINTILAQEQNKVLTQLEVQRVQDLGGLSEHLLQSNEMNKQRLYRLDQFLLRALLHDLKERKIIEGNDSPQVIIKQLVNFLRAQPTRGKDGSDNVSWQHAIQQMDSQIGKHAMSIQMPLDPNEIPNWITSIEAEFLQPNNPELKRKALGIATAQLKKEHERSVRLEKEQAAADLQLRQLKESLQGLEQTALKQQVKNRELEREHARLQLALKVAKRIIRK